MVFYHRKCTRISTLVSRQPTLTFVHMSMLLQCRCLKKIPRAATAREASASFHRCGGRRECSDGGVCRAPLILVLHNLRIGVQIF